MSSPKIAIVGAGPAGLTAGVLLYKQRIPFTIFELRPKPTDEEFSKPSGSLDLHDESGIAALKECGLADEFFKLTNECTEAQKVLDKQGNLLYANEGEQNNRPEISRHALTQLLLSHIPANSVRWGHKLISVVSSTVLGRAEIELDFGVQGKQKFDLVIGADGAWSRVRSLLTGIKPSYEGRHSVTLTMRNITKKHPHLAELVGTGTLAALGNRHGIVSQRGSVDSARIYCFISSDDEGFAATAGLAGQTAAATKEKLLSDDSLLGTWAPSLKELVAIACDEEMSDNPGRAVDIRPMYTLPIGMTWEHKRGVTVVGDAAHLMGPYAGEGVNLAMWDSLLLSKAIVEACQRGGEDIASFQTVLDPLIKGFELDMVARAQEKAEDSFQNGQVMFGEDGANRFAQFFLGSEAPDA